MKTNDCKQVIVNNLKINMIVVIATLLFMSASNADDKIKVLILDGQNNHDWATTTDFTSSGEGASDITYNGEYLYVFSVCASCGPQGIFAHITYRVDPSDDQNVAEPMRALS